MREGDAGYLDPAGNKVPETLYFGKGPAHAVPQRPGRARHLDEEVASKHPVQLRTAAGPLKVPAGHVWIELVPTDKAGGKVTFRK